MELTIAISAVTCLLMVLAVLFFPKLKLGKLSVSSYWAVTLAGAATLLLTGQVDFSTVSSALLADTAINPIKILVLFISMTILSIFLDELGFFRFLANFALKRAGKSQMKLFMLLYITVSVLTVFTSNDIIILSFTPFICYFAKNAKISPMPYLAAEFVAANTWSMALIIGNPTNVYLVTAAGGDFVSYLQVMLLPTLASGAIAFGCLFLLFRKKLSAPICAEPEDVQLTDKFSLWVGILHLAVCTVLLAVGSYIGIEMWLVSALAAVSLFVWTIGASIVRRRRPDALLSCLKRAPWELIPFILSMFVMVEALNANGITAALFRLMGQSLPVWKYGFSSFLAANLINNIPMSVLYSSILAGANSPAAVYATVVGSNLGACLTPIGALAGIMWSSILKEHNLKFGYLDFLKIGVTVAIPALAAALCVLQLLF
jgi:arsenical pump membrane protein